MTSYRKRMRSASGAHFRLLSAPTAVHAKRDVAPVHGALLVLVNRDVARPRRPIVDSIQNNKSMSENIVGDWLCTLCLSQYIEGFLDNGYDDLEICKQIGEPDLDAIGVTDSGHRSLILRAVKTLREHGATAVYFTVEEAAAAVHQIKTTTCPSKPNYSTYMYDDELPPPQTTVITGSDSPADVDAGAAHETAIYLRKYLDEYEEGKAELVKIPRLQLKGLVRDKLARDGLRLCSPPYSNAVSALFRFKVRPNGVTDNQYNHNKTELNETRNTCEHEVILFMLKIWFEQGLKQVVNGK
uniref:Sterile alpha motif domain-containing protein 5 n=1 Tax=Strigamia maritima TaxID=126957 RepID=T1JKM9_STRMM